MATHERWTRVLEILARDGRLQVEAAGQELGVSQATIRRDLDHLAQHHMLARTRGGAIPNGVTYGLPLRYKRTGEESAKQRIGRAAAAFIEPGSVVGLNGGTTTTEVARALVGRPELASSNGRPQLTVVTNALNIGYELALRPNIKLVLTGGSTAPDSYELSGPLAALIPMEITVDYAIMGAHGIASDWGASTHSEDEARVNRVMAQRARQVIVVADASKLERKAFALICGLDQIAVLVTDSSAPADVLERYSQSGVRVICA